MNARVLSEFIGTAILLATIVGSGIMADTLAPAENVAVALLAHAAAVGAILYVLITILGPIGGAHFNPSVTLMFVLRRELPARLGGAYVVAQLIGAAAGVLLAHLMFDQELLQLSARERSSVGIVASEVVATFGLCLTILLAVAHRPDSVASAVGLFIFAGLWFTASTAFANPAVTIARALTNTFTGIRPADIAPFVAAQLVAVPLALISARALGVASRALDG
ncbi:MAG: aquaporin [Myxococcota bacterium]